MSSTSTSGQLHLTLETRHVCESHLLFTYVFFFIHTFGQLMRHHHYHLFKESNVVKFRPLCCVNIALKLGNMALKLVMK